MATTLVVKDIMASGGDYTNLATFAAAIPDDISAATGTEETWIAEGYNDDFDGTGNNLGMTNQYVFFDGITTDANNKVKVYPASADEQHDGTMFTADGFGVKKGASSNTVIRASCHFEMRGLRIWNNSGIGTSSHGIATVSDAYVDYIDMILYTPNGRGVNNSLSNARYINNISFEAPVEGFTGNNYEEPQFLNCVSDSAPTGFRSALLGTTYSVVKNCAVYNASTESYGGTWNTTDSTNNAASDGATTTPPGQNPITTNLSSTDFADASDYDFHLSGSSSLLYDAGADLSSTFDYDIDGDTRVEWSIGIDDLGGPTAANDSYNVTSGTQLVVNAADGILDNDTYNCG